MRSRFLFAFALGAAILLAGCGSAPSSVSTPATTYPNLTGNWQIQSGAAPTTTPSVGILLLGALESQGMQVSGTFRFTNLAATLGSCPLNQVVTVSGSVTSAGNLTLTSAPFSGHQLTLQLLLPSAVLGTAQETGVGTLAVTGTGPCAFPSGPALGLLFPPITGSYQGAVTLYQGLPGTSPGTSGSTAALTLTQATTPNSDGTFPVTGAAQITSGSCTASTPITGTISGLELALSSLPITAFGGANLQINGVVTPPTSQVLVDLIFATGPCSSGFLVDYQGTLAKQ